MFLSVTPNPPIDKIIFISQWTPGVPQHALKLATSVGGKGLDASVALRHLSQPTTGLFMAAGAAGRELEGLVRAYGIEPEIVWTGGETRTAHIIAETATQLHTHIFTGGLELNDEIVEVFLARYGNLLDSAKWVLTGGSIPPGIPVTFFAKLTEMASRAHKPILIDSFKEPLLLALPAQPTIVKMNRAEFSWTFGENVENFDDLTCQMQNAAKRHNIHALVVTCGAQGILALTQDGLFHAQPPPQTVVNAAGAGDSSSAALVWRLDEGDGWCDALRWAAAVSAASVLTDGTADLRFEDACRILPEVKVKRLG